MDEAAVEAYLGRIGVARPTAAEGGALRELHRAHLVAVPFENLSIHLGEEIVLDEAALRAKVVEGRRGGFCFELNGAFASLLRALGYGVELLAGRVFAGRRLSVPYSHLALRVAAADGSRWLADVGYGQHSQYPLALEVAGDQREPGGVFRIEPVDEGDLEVFMNGTPEYRLERRARALAEFEVGSWYHRTSPESHFTRSLICSRLTEDGGRVTLSGRRLVTTDAAGVRTERKLAGGEVLEVYRTRFGIELDREPRVSAP